MAENADDLDAVVVLTRFLSPAERLVDEDVAAAARRARVPLIYDPDTWPLTEISADAPGGVESLLAMRSAGVAPLPLSPEDLEDVDPIVGATMAVQVGAAYPSPPYFGFASLSDPWLDVNLRCIVTGARRAHGRPLAAFVRGEPEALTSGALAASAQRYAEVLPRGSLVFLSVAGLQPGEAEPEELEGYLAAVRAFDVLGFRVVADRVARFARIAVAAGAAGGSWGTRIYRTTPPHATWTNDFNVIVPVPYFAALRGDHDRFEKAQGKLRRGTFPPCPVSDCDAHEGQRTKRTARKLRVHANHLFRDELRAAGQVDVRVLIADLQAGIKEQRLYGVALEAVLRRAQAL